MLERTTRSRGEVDFSSGAHSPSSLPQLLFVLHIDFSCAFCAGFLKRESINEQANNRLKLAFGALCGCGYPD